MASDSLISIVLPTYNGSHFIDKSILSCLTQSHHNLELIIVDDASSDDTPNKIAKYAAKDSRIFCIRHETNRKLPASLNTGFTQAKGEYLTWTSDDNIYRSDALETMLDFLRSHAEIDMVYSDFSIVDEENQLVKFEKVKTPKELLKGNCVGPSFLFRRKVMDVVGPYSEDLILAEDYDYWLRISAHFKMMPLHKDLYCYRIHRRSLTSSGLDRRHRVTEKALARTLPLMKWVTPSEISESYTILSRIALNQHDWWAIQKYLFKAFLFSPSFFLHYCKNVLWRRCGNILKSCDYL